MDPPIENLKRKSKEKSIPTKKRKHTVLTLKQKQEIVAKIDAGMPKVKIAQDYNIGQSTVTDIYKNKEKTAKFIKYIDNKSITDKRSIVREAYNVDLDRALIMWFNQERSKGTPVTGDMILEEAVLLHENFEKDLESEKKTIFNPSTGFLNAFKNRHGIRSLTVQGEKLSADFSSVESFFEKFHKILNEGGYTPDQIYNCDETGLYWKALPRRTMQSMKERRADGFKISKERVSLLLCSNASGSHSLRPLVIGKYRNPRCFKTIRSSLPVNYQNNSSSWMTREIFFEWFHSDFKPSVLRNLSQLNLPHKALLILDNAPVHFIYETDIDNEIRVLLLPPNTTSLIQPMDQGVIQCFKMNYRKKFMRNILATYDDKKDSILDRLQAFTLKECIFLISETWNKVSKSALANAWNKFEINYGLSIESNTLAPSDELTDDLKLVLQLDNSEIDEYMNIDSSDQGFEFLTRSEIVNLIKLENEKQTEENEEMVKINDIRQDSISVSHREAIQAIQTIITYSEDKDCLNDETIKFFLSVREIIENAMFSELKQKSIMNFLTKKLNG